MMANGNILVARETGVLNYEGERVYIHAGVTRVREGHGILKGHEHMFKPLDAHFEVEDTRARPETAGRKPVKKTVPADGDR
jgi:hypothetical protein